MGDGEVFRLEDEPAPPYPTVVIYMTTDGVYRVRWPDGLDVRVTDLRKAWEMAMVPRG